MIPRDYPWTTDQTPTLRLLLSATTAMQGKRWVLKVPFNTVAYDQRPGQMVRAFNVKGASCDPPAGVRFVGHCGYRNEDNNEVRKTVLAGIQLTFECDEDAAAFEDLPVTLFFDGAATETKPTTVVMPALTPTVGSPWTVTSAAGSAIGIAVQGIQSVSGAYDYKGLWDAATNTPELESGVGTAGDTYIVGVSGTTELDGTDDWLEGEQLAFNGTVWQRIPVNNAVFHIANHLAEGNASAIRGTLGLKGFALKDDDAVVIDLEGLSGTQNLTSGNIPHQVLHLIGKIAGNVTLQLPASQAGTWRFINETTGGFTITLANTGGLRGASSMALRPGVNELFVANRSSSSVSVLDSATGEVLRTFTGLSTPNALTFSEDGATLYVALGTSSATVKAIDAETGVESASYSVPLNPRGLLLDTEHNCLWVSCAGGEAQNETNVARIALDTGTVTEIAMEDDYAPLDSTYNALHIRANADFSKIYLWGSGGNGHEGTSTGVVIKQCFVIDPTDNSYTHFDVGGQSGGGLVVDEDHVYIARGGRSLRYYDVATGVLIGGLSVGNRGMHLSRAGNYLYCSNLDDKTITVYDVTTFEELPLVPLEHAPDTVVPVEVSGDARLWVSFTSNNAVALVDPATGTVERRTALGPLEPLVLERNVMDVASDGNRLWRQYETPGAVAAPVITSTRLFDPQDYFEKRLTSTSETVFQTYSVSDYTASNSAAVPYATVARTAGTHSDSFISNLLPVQRGAELALSLWLMRPVGATGEVGSLSLSLLLFDKDKRPAGTAGILSDTPVADGLWRELSAEYTLPLTHTPVDNSDGGPVCFVQVRVSVNTKPALYTGAMQEIQWGGVRIDYAETARTQTLYADEATETVTVQCGAGSFTVAPDATASEVQTAIRATAGNGAVVVTGGTTDTGGAVYTGAFVFTWPPGITPAPLLVTDPLDDTWRTESDAGGALVNAGTGADGVALLRDSEDGQEILRLAAGSNVTLTPTANGVEIAAAGGGGGGEFATTEEAEAGVNTTKYMNPALTAAAIAAQVPGGGGGASGYLFKAILSNVATFERLGLRAVGETEITAIADISSAANWKSAFQDNADMDVDNAVVTTNLTGTDAKTGFVDIGTIQSCPEVEVVSGEVRSITGDEPVTYNGVSINPGDDASTVEMNIQFDGTGTGDDQVSVRGGFPFYSENNGGYTATPAPSLIDGDTSIGVGNMGAPNLCGYLFAGTPRIISSVRMYLAGSISYTLTMVVQVSANSATGLDGDWTDHETVVVAYNSSTPGWFNVPITVPVNSPGVRFLVVGAAGAAVIHELEFNNEPFPDLLDFRLIYPASLGNIPAPTSSGGTVAVMVEGGSAVTNPRLVAL